MKTLLWLALRKVKWHVYEAGFRPKPGSLLYSPSLNYIYGLRSQDPLRGMREAINQHNAAQTAWQLKQKDD